MSTIVKKEDAALLLGMVLTFGAAVFYGAQLKVPVISDEVITLANGEYLLGNDWGYLIAATGSYYYKWFYGVLMTPLLWLFRDNPHNAYRAMMIINGMLQASTMPVCYLICRRYLNVKSTWNAALMGMCVAFVPSVFLYAFYARGDVFLCVAPWYVLLLLLEGLKVEAEKRRNRQALCTALAAVISMVAYMAHTRGIVVIIALVLTALIMQISVKRSPVNWAVLLFLIGAAFVLDTLLAGRFKQVLYWLNGTQANTLDSISMSAYFDVFSITTIKGMIGLSVAWLFTLICSSFGLVLLGFGVGLFLVICFLCRSVVAENEKVIAVFGILLFAGYFLVGLLLFKGDFHALKYGELNRRVDSLLYDRYSCCGLGMIVFLAIYALAVRPDCMTRFMRIGTIVACGVVLLFFFWKCYDVALRYPGYLYNTILLNTFSEVEDHWQIIWGGYYSPKALLGSAAVGVFGLLAILVWSGQSGKSNRIALLTFIMLCQIVLIEVNYQKVRKATDVVVANSTETVVEFIEEIDDALDGFPCALKWGSGGVKIQFYQFQLPDLQLFGKEQLDQVHGDYLVISSPDDIVAFAESSDLVFCFADVDYDAAAYDAVYVYGEELAQRLAQCGFELYPLEAS